MGRFFPFRRPQRGKPISTRGLAAGLAGMDEALTGMRVENGQVVWSSNNIPTIVFGDDGCGSFPGRGMFPPGGEEYQVLQLDADLEPVWDWVRYVVPSEEE
jgi:hypothetical protein